MAHKERVHSLNASLHSMHHLILKDDTDAKGEGGEVIERQTDRIGDTML